MSDSMILALSVLFILFLIGSVVAGIYLLSVNVLNPEGKGAAKKTTRILLKYAVIRRFRVLRDVRLSYKGKVYVIENMLIGYFGILLVHTLGGRGEFYGQLDSASWKRVLEGKSHTFPNPVIEQEGAMAALRAVFSKNKAYNIPMENIVYMTNRSKKTGLFITNDNKIFFPGKLASYLGKTKFDKDIGIDVDKLVGIIEQQKLEG